MVGRIGHGHDPAGAEGDIPGPPKLAGPKHAAAQSIRSVRSELIGERAVGVEHLDAVVSRVGHGHDPAGAEGDAVGAKKLAGARSIRSELIGERGVGIEHLDAIVFKVGHGHDPAGAEGDVAGPTKLAGARSIRSEHEEHGRLSADSVCGRQPQRNHCGNPNDNS